MLTPSQLAIARAANSSLMAEDGRIGRYEKRLNEGTGVYDEVFVEVWRGRCEIRMPASPLEHAQADVDKASLRSILGIPASADLVYGPDLRALVSGRRYRVVQEIPRTSESKRRFAVEVIV